MMSTESQEPRKDDGAESPAPNGKANGRQLPFRRGGRRRLKVEDLPELSDEQLQDVANSHHRAFAGSLRKAMTDHARLAGAALLQLKARLKQGSWGDWLKKHFRGSAETARLYMRVAKHWHLIVEQGLDRKGMTLEDLRWVLSESPSARPGSKQPGANPEQAPAGLKLDTEDAGAEENRPGKGDAEPTPPSTVRQVQLLFGEDDREEFDGDVEYLMGVFHTDNVTDTVFKAVRECRRRVEEEHRG
jgi:hypothetical protein